MLLGMSAGISSRRLGLAAMCAALLGASLLLGAPGAIGAEEEEEEGPTRAEYKAAVEPICKRNKQLNSRVLKGVRRQVQANRLVPAGKRFIFASRALTKAVRQIARVPRPPEDVARLKRWITYLNRERVYLLWIGKALIRNNKFQAQKLAVQLNRNNNRANNVVIAFGFRECRIDSSAFL